jgi:hypothetical protein
MVVRGKVYASEKVQASQGNVDNVTMRGKKRKGTAWS